MRPPSVVTETDRLVLRRPTGEDLNELVAIHADPEIERFMDRFGEAEARSWLARQDRSWTERGYGRMILVEKGSGRMLGRSGLGWFDELGDTELGWTLRRDAWGHGYATEAARHVADWAFRTFGFDHLISMIEPDNARSASVAGRLGMSVDRTTTWLDRTFEVHLLTRRRFLDRHAV